MKVNSNVARMLEDEYLQKRICYGDGETQYNQGVPITEPPSYNNENKTQAWLMGWRSAEYASKQRHH